MILAKKTFRSNSVSSNFVIKLCWIASRWVCNPVRQVKSRRLESLCSNRQTAFYILPVPTLYLTWFLFIPLESSRKTISNKTDMAGCISYGHLKIVGPMVLKSDFGDNLYPVNSSLDTATINGNLL